MKLGYAGLLVAAASCSCGCNAVEPAYQPIKPAYQLIKPAYQAIETAYQRDTDETRIRHVKQIAGLAETFKESEGHYPHERLEDGDCRVFRLVRGRQLWEVPDDHDDLAQLMGKGIAEPFNLPYDPQNFAVYTNRFYSYWSDGQRYAVCAQLGTSHPGAVEGGPYHFVYTIESDPEAAEAAPHEAEGQGPGADAVNDAASALDIERMKELLAAGADVNARDAEGMRPLHAAVFASYNVPECEMVKLLLDRGANVNAKTPGGLTALHIAANTGHRELVAILADAGANLDAETPPSILWELEGKNALYIALQNGYDELAELLAAKGAALDIFTASALGETERMEELLDADGQRINARSMHRFTPLHWAAVCGRKEAAELLLARGADLNARGVNGLTPLEYAVELGHKDVASLLRRHVREPR